TLQGLGIDPESPEGQAYAREANRGADLRAQGELAQLMDETTKRAEEQIRALREDAAVIGMTAREAARFRAEQAMLNDAQSRGIELTDEQKAQISGLADAYAQAAEELRLLEEHQKA